MALPSTPQSAQELANLIFNQVQKSTEKVSDRTFKRGVVVAVNGRKCDVEVEGSPVATENIMCLDSYYPKVGDKVLLLSIGQTGTNLVILGALESRISGLDAGWGWRLYYTADGRKEWKTRGSTVINVPGNSLRYANIISFPYITIGQPERIPSLSNDYYVEGTAGVSPGGSIAVEGVYAAIGGTSTSITLRNRTATAVDATVVYSYTITEK